MIVGHYLRTAGRVLARDRLYTVINIVGLAIAIAAAILIGLYVRDELTYEHFIPGYQQVYRLSVITHPSVDALLRLGRPELLRAVRITFHRGTILCH
jgi:hypothetical protein